MAVIERARRARRESEALIMGALASANQPLSANRLAALLSDRDRPLWPNQVYRALKFLCQRGRIRRVELLKAYMLAAEGQDIALVCSGCGGTETAQGTEIRHALETLAVRHGFRPTRIVVEAEGQCTNCRRRVTEPALRRAQPLLRNSPVSASMGYA